MAAALIQKSGRMLLLAICGVATFAAAASLSGTWKLNLAKSRLSGQTATISKGASDIHHFESEGFGYDFDLTGKEYPTPDGGTTSWRALDSTTWEVTNRMQGKVIASYKLSAKGDVLTSIMKVTKPDGTTVAQNAVWQRVSSGEGLFGTWKAKEVKGAPTTLEIMVSGDNITLSYPEFKQTSTGSFDGKDNIMKTAGEDSKQTLAFEKTGPNTFRVTTKLNGKPMYTDVFTLAADGKTLTDDGNAVSVNEPTKAVYDRQ